MKQSRILLTCAVVAAGLAMPSLGLAGKGEEKFDPAKTYAAVLGPYAIQDDTITLQSGLVQPLALTGAAPDTTIPCSGTVDFKIVDAAGGSNTVIASQSDVALAPGSARSFSYTGSPASSATVYAVIVARGMSVDSKTCLLRSSLQVNPTDSASVDVEKHVFRQEFGAVQSPRH